MLKKIHKSLFLKFLFLIAILIQSCGDITSGEKVLVAPSGVYILKATVKSKNDDSRENPRYLWFVSIHDKQNNLIYEDKDSDFVGYLNIKIAWDENDRAWVYNTDNSQIFFWEKVSNKWIKNDWDADKTKMIQRKIYPPKF
ncbi:hypothetical protein [Pseudanabaena sp. 'Roaring Creek']|uniref:hypothetical protein n=1 Tax=Pseudanabaena sp. 'Roaring Creek' TaxID=1681830 RepID=UPI0006D7DF77|nr:hypothetical protein [Pseudanabaena sp. 'Roaring Creek']